MKERKEPAKRSSAVRVREADRIRLAEMQELFKDVTGVSITLAKLMTRLFDIAIPPETERLRQMARQGE